MHQPTRILSISLALAALAAAHAQTAAPGGPRPPGAGDRAPNANSSAQPVRGGDGAPPSTDAYLAAPLRVTADLWESPLSRLPASVTVYDEAALRSGAVRDFADLTNEIPNLTFTGGTSRPRYFQIRGIGENSQFEGETPDSTVRFLIDDFDFTGLGTVGSTFDTRQVEVLRGPQAGAFGANAAGGVVRLVSNAPTPFWTGQTEASLGGDDFRSVGLAVGGPLTKARPDELMVRLAVQNTQADGFRRNVTLNRDTNARDESTARLRLTWNPNDLWRWEAAALVANFDNGYDEFALDNNGERTFSNKPGRDEQRSVAASLRGTYRGLPAGVRLTTVTSGARTESRYAYDDDWTVASYEGFSDLYRTRWVLNQELRLDSDPAVAREGWVSRWTLGAFYADVDEWSRYYNTDPGNVRGLRTIYKSTNAALFGQVGHDFSARTRLIVGLRAERLDLDGKGIRTRFRASRGTFDAPVEFTPAFADTLIGGKVSLEHELRDGLLAFASVTRGYKGGGINVDARISPPADPLTYGTETLWNYEAGVRGNWLGGAARGELTVFHLARSDTQVRDSAGFGGNYRFFTANGRDSHVTGLEASGAYDLTREFTLHASLALMDSELARFTLANGSVAGGRTLANTPKHGYTLGARYKSAGGFFADATLVGRAQQFDSNNQNEARRAFRVVNASAGYAWGPWTFTLWAKNLFDEVYDKRVYFFGNEDPNYLETRYENRADPRQLGVTAAYRF